MNMHGFVTRSEADAFDEDLSPWKRFVHRFAGLRPLFLLVFLPTALVAIYYFGFASDQYESEAHFIVDSKNSSSSPASGAAEILGLSSGGSDQSQMMSVPDYLKSHDAVDALSRVVDLTAIFRRPEADALSRLGKANPTPEDLLRYYKGKVTVKMDHDTGITELSVRTFRPQDSYRVVNALLKLSEARVNDMNMRRYKDAVALAQTQVDQAEHSVADIQRRMTAYRQSSRDVDPKMTGTSQIQLVATLSNSLAAARARLQTMRGFISPDSPQYLAALRQVQSLTAQVAAQKATLTGGTDDIATNLGGYEDLTVRQEFAAKQYETAAGALQKAREEAMAQQLYLIRVVNPNVPVKSEFPERGRIVGTIFLALLLAYGIGWLILAGVREHAA